MCECSGGHGCGSGRGFLEGGFWRRRFERSFCFADYGAHISGLQIKASIAEDNMEKGKKGDIHTFLISSEAS